MMGIIAFWSFVIYVWLRDGVEVRLWTLLLFALLTGLDVYRIANLED